jgi:hypothetical protein
MRSDFCGVVGAGPDGTVTVGAVPHVPAALGCATAVHAMTGRVVVVPGNVVVEPGVVDVVVDDVVGVLEPEEIKRKAELSTPPAMRTVITERRVVRRRAS